MNKYPVLTLSALVASIGLAAVFPSRYNDLESSAINAVSDKGFTVLEERIAVLPQTRENASVQRLINSGQFDPPPGNTERLNSAVSPFSRFAQAVAHEFSGKTDTNRQNQPTQASVREVVSAHGSNGTISAIVGQDNQSSNNQALAQLQNQSSEFESPPGIGSAKGGQ
jgi:hypothetical protein